MHQAQAPEGDSLLDRATGNLMRLVTVRPVGADAEGDDPPARVARAEAALAAGDLAAAVAEIEALDGAAGGGRRRLAGRGQAPARRRPPRSTGCAAARRELLAQSG